MTWDNSEFFAGGKLPCQKILIALLSQALEGHGRGEEGKKLKEEENERK